MSNERVINQAVQEDALRALNQALPKGVRFVLLLNTDTEAAVLSAYDAGQVHALLRKALAVFPGRRPDLEIDLGSDDPVDDRYKAPEVLERKYRHEG